MERLTNNKEVSEMSMFELAHNSCYRGDDGWARYRDYENDFDARELAIKLLEKYADVPNEFICDDDFDNFILDSLQYGTDSIQGLIAVFYQNLWAMADLRERLAEYEDLQEKLDKQFDGCLSMKEFIDSIIEYDKQCSRNEKLAEAMMITNEDARQYREWKKLKKQGRLPEFPCAVGDVTYIPDKFSNKVREHLIEEIRIDLDGIWIINTSGNVYAPNDFGKIVFPTREEAEQALERGKENEQK